jgi:MraZ protein
MFGGTYTHSLDPAGRFIMPHVFRTSLGPEFYITKGVGCLCVFTDEYAKAMEEQLRSLGSPLEILLNPDIARLHRHFFSDMVKTKADSQNRVPITPEHRKYTGIDTEVTICGCGQYIELWLPEALEAYRADNESTDSLILAGSMLLDRSKGNSDVGLPSTSSAR